ncbi:hypothetical protein EZV62_010917 [Acer yangbiense]|uniref:Cns1/TTC4 wheel domain-containing protein n=1 Tax=Acer yangbiense TaxID=1000413 RepID=A0A5C7I320_9ROSI|nr:hypothetical protein EZV62_010917 [Acer yangbiense]
MALWMEKGSDPTTESEIADLQAIAALKESAALEFKVLSLFSFSFSFSFSFFLSYLVSDEKGNEYVRQGKKHYSDAIDCYTRAINQNALSDSETSILYANRSHVNLLLGNYRRALTDAEEAIKLCTTNVKQCLSVDKAHYRAAKSSLLLNLLDEAKLFCDSGLERDPDNKELKKLARKIDFQKQKQEEQEAQVSKALAEAKDLSSAIENRGLKIGKPMFQELTGLRKPVLDKNSILHWPVLLLYAELSNMFSEDSPPLSWDKENNYTREAIELYYEAGSGIFLSKTKLLRYLLEGTAGANVESIGDEEKDLDGSISEYSAGKGSSKWVKVNEKRKLHDILKEPNFIIPGIPVFYVVSMTSSFYKDFRAGKWAPPS